MTEPAKREGAVGVPCREPGCPAIIVGGSWCPKHQRTKDAADTKRITRTRERDPFYNLRQWRRLSKLKLTRNPVCEKCRVREAREVDHIKPRAEHPELSFVMENLESLCWHCHRRKSTGEDRRRKRE